MRAVHATTCTRFGGITRRTTCATRLESDGEIDGDDVREHMREDEWRLTIVFTPRCRRVFVAQASRQRMVTQRPA